MFTFIFNISFMLKFSVTSIATDGKFSVYFAKAIDVYWCNVYPVGSSYDILVGHGDHISQVHFEGTSSETVRTDTTGTVVGVDYLFS